MHNPRAIPQTIPLFEIFDSKPSPFTKDLFRSRLKKYRQGLAMVLVSLEQEFGQSLGVVSHLFAVWRMITTSRKDNMSYYVLLTCCWWLTLHHNKMIKRSEVVKQTGLSLTQCSQHLRKAITAGYLSHTKQYYYLTDRGSRFMNEFFAECFSVVLDLYDENP